MRLDEVAFTSDPALGSSPNVGDLWLLSWDQDALGLCVVAGIAPTFVLVWPASLPTDEVYPPAIAVPSNQLSMEVVVWPTRETGVGLHLLNRPIARLMSSRSMALALDALENQSTESPYGFVQTSPAGLDAEDASDRFVDKWEAICLHTWPAMTLGQAPFSPDALRRSAVTASVLAELLEASPSDVVGLLRGENYPSADQVARVADRAGVSPEDLLGVPDVVVDFARPAFKEQVLQLSLDLEIGEFEARELVRQDLALAARSDGDASGLIRAAIERVRDAGRTRG